MNLQSLYDQAFGSYRAGNLADAERLYLQIIRADPHQFTALHLLGIIRHSQGQSAEALRLIGAALKLNPGDGEALSNYGVVLKALGRFQEALAVYDAILAANPGYAEALYNRGLVLRDLTRFEEALASYDKALAVRPDFAEILNSRGLVLVDMKRFDEALASYDKALAIRPGYAKAWNNRGLVLTYLGKLDEARAAHLQSLALDPGMTNVYLDYVDVVTVAAGDPQLQAMETMRDGHIPLSDMDRIQLDFALAKAYADVKDHKRSFACLLSGNALKRAQIPYDEPAALDFFDRIETIFTAQLVREKEALGAGDPLSPGTGPAPIFILGMMRSGTTLVEQILASHPGVHGAGELPAFSDVVDAQREETGYPEFVPDLDARAIDRIGARYLAEIRKLAPTASHITDKMPANFFFAGLIHLALPNARIIHTVRDPLDTCISCFSKLFTAGQHHSYDLAELGRYYRRYRTLMAHWQRVLPPDRILDVHYEDVVADLEGQARRIVAHCGLDWDTRCLSFHTSGRPVRTASASQVRRQIYPAAVGRSHVYSQFLGPLKDALAGT